IVLHYTKKFNTIASIIPTKDKMTKYKPFILNPISHHLVFNKLETRRLVKLTGDVTTDMLHPNMNMKLKTNGSIPTSSGGTCIMIKRTTIIWCKAMSVNKIIKSSIVITNNTYD